MSTMELQSPPSSIEDADSASSHELSLQGPAAEKRLCIAAFMDRHPETFSPPEAAVTWTEFVEQRCTPQGRDQLTLDMAVGRLIQVMRSAQEGIPERADLNEILHRAEQEGVENLEPDPAVQAIASADAPAEDVRAMARAMTLYKECMSRGVANGDEILSAIHAGFDHVPATSPFMQSLIDTAKEVTMIDVRFALGVAA